MKTKRIKEVAWRLIYILLPSGALLGAMWFWLLLLVSFWLIWMLIGVPPDEGAPPAETQPRMLQESDQPAVIRDAMNVRIATEEDGVQVFRGRLRESAAAVYETLKSAFSDRAVPLIQEDEKLGSAIILLPKPVEEATMESRSARGCIGCFSASRCSRRRGRARHIKGSICCASRGSLRLGCPIRLLCSPSWAFMNSATISPRGGTGSMSRLRSLFRCPLRWEPSARSSKCGHPPRTAVPCSTSPLQGRSRGSPWRFQPCSSACVRRRFCPSMRRRPDTCLGERQPGRRCFLPCLRGCWHSSSGRA